MSDGLFRRASIGRKLMLIGQLTTGFAVLAVSIALIIGGVLDWRSRTVSDLETYATMIGANAAPAVMFDDRKAAADTLSALAAKRSVTYAAIADKAGRTFAEYRAPGEAAPDVTTRLDPYHFMMSSVAVSRPIVFKGERFGTIVVQSDLRDVFGDLARNLTLIVVAALIAFAAATALFRRLQGSIVAPITGLARTMQTVSTTQTYSARVPVHSRDEVGILSQEFNGMLEHIERRDAELAQHRERLEKEVERRTAELSASHAQLQRYSGQIDLLSRMGATLQTCLAQDEVAAVVGPHLVRLLPEWSGALYLLKNSRNLLEAADMWGRQRSAQTVFAPNDCWALRRGLVHVAAEALAAPRCPHADTGAISHVCVPLMAQGEVLGTLYLHNSGPMLEQADQGLLSRVAGEVAQALASLRYREALRNMAIRDPLTGLFNRRYLEEYLEMEIARTHRKGAKLSVVMIDIDHFKRFNDTFGHEAGDAILREIGQFLLRQTRTGDAACRYGGEEFIVAMWEATPDAALERAETLREEVKLVRVQAGGKLLPPITMSLGIAAFPDHATLADDLVRAADRALYKAKFSGRDRVCVAGSE
jgi:diguanylate cyclase (GGDEF)-like protein